MSDITLDFRPKVREKDIETLKSALVRLGPREELKVIIESSDAHQAERIGEIMESFGLDYQPRGGHDNEYWIIGKLTARKV